MLENNYDNLGKLLAASVIKSLNDLQNGTEFVSLLNSPQPDLRGEAWQLFDEVNDLKDRLQTLLL